MIRRFIIILLQIAICLSASATSMTDKEVRRQMKSIREHLKDQKGAEALQSVETLRKDSAYSMNPQILQYGVEACKILNNNENEKIYLKSKPDTAAFFNTLYNVYEFILLTDSAERTLAHSGQVNSKNAKDDVAKNHIRYRFRKQNVDFVTRNFRNLAAANRYFTAKSCWNDARRFTAMSIDVATSSIGRTLKQPLADEKQISQFAVAFVNSCFADQQYADIDRFADYALRDSSSRERVLEKFVLAKEYHKSSADYLCYLKEGHECYPTNMFFFSRLVDSYVHDNASEAVLSTANKTLEAVLAAAQEEAEFCIIDIDGDYQQPSEATALSGVRSSVVLPDNDIAQIFEARAIAYHNMKQPELCIEEAKNILSWNPHHVRAPFYIGASYYRLAENVQIPSFVTDVNYQTATAERNSLLRLARPYLERYRSLAPAENAVWAPLLYEVYLYLNLGAEFEEIERFIP